jgi:PIN domain-containing protein
MFKILVDTCVWLDIAKDYQQQPLLSALEQFIEHGDVTLILPRIVVDEFARNKGRVAEEAGRSLSSTMKRVKDAVEKFGDPRQNGVCCENSMTLIIGFRHSAAPCQAQLAVSKRSLQRRTL